MITVPAPVWRGGFARRALTVGAATGLFAGVMAWLDSGVPAVGALVFVIVGAMLGVLAARRMARYWPGAADLDGAQRVTVVSAARRGDAIDPPLAAPLLGYCRGLHEAADRDRPLRRLIAVLLIVAVGTAVWDAAYGSWGNVVASVIYLALLGFEVLWWPRRRAELLTNVDRAANLARTHSSD
ncbi:hypothetical protein E4P42_10790 [Mycobacterium sp. PS03-16]|uniref:hypothetical protein n=1 Tax=Mycobacterium sp. PS03-16 TaxID=2559611 RepID=UPI001074231C|nr:hypothetical protein [Mycobacterium sp. PS03-16]TFV58967.1 hypothetical protein E4P42_10790 [Mycobacterium sp. PS03-16]